jgi:hypothetical protein
MGSAGARADGAPHAGSGFLHPTDAGDVRLVRISSSQQLVSATETSTESRTVARSLDCSCTGPRTYTSISSWTPHRGRPASASVAEPTFAPDELAGRKVIALFDRAAARDFVDVHALGRRFTKTKLLELAREVYSGFDIGVFTDMLRHLARYGDVDLALGDIDIPVLRAFFRQWITELDLGVH